MAKRKYPKRDLYTEITNKMIEDLEHGVIPWVRPWKNGKTTIDMPRNAESGRAYSGINLLLLWCSPYADQRWLTFPQIKRLGGSNKGQKATTVAVWVPYTKTNAKGVEEKKLFLGAHSLFNLEQITGIDESKLCATPDQADLKATSGTDLAEKVGAKLLAYGGNRAYYVPLVDAIRLPTQDQFHGENNFDATMYHELTHWTGHKSRKDRNLSGRFGDHAYAAEELIAEMGSAFLCARLGTKLEGLQHPSYIDHWLKMLKSDNSAIFGAARHAREAVEFMLDRDDKTE